MKHLRLRKNNRKIRRITLAPATPAERVELDKNVFDLVLRVLYENSGHIAMDLEKDIFAHSKVKLPHNEAQRIWDVLISSGWISPAIGFGKAGKIELTRAGYQMMSQFGGYTQYLASIQTGMQPQTIILPIQIEGEAESEAPKELPGKTGQLDE